MRHPFPFALGIGTDICNIARIYRVLTSQNSSAQQFARHVLNPTEIREHASRLMFGLELDTMKATGNQLVELRSELTAAKAWRLAQFLGGRWAAKEAAIKAYTWRRISKHDITILGGHQEAGRTAAPTMMIKARNGSEERVAKISISHDGDFATAVCLAAEEPEESGSDLPFGSVDVDQISVEEAASSEGIDHQKSFSGLPFGGP